MLSISQRTTIGEILELPQGQAIDLNLAKKNYRRLIRIYHPDINKSQEAELYTKKLNWAWGIVTGKSKRINIPPPPPRPSIRIIITVTNPTQNNGWNGSYWYRATSRTTSF